MLYTISDERKQPLLVLCASGARSANGPHGPEGARWRVHVSDPGSPLAGLSACGDSVLAARDALATRAWTAVVSGELAEFGVTAREVAGIHLQLTTCARYERDALTATIEGAA